MIQAKNYGKKKERKKENESSSQFKTGRLSEPIQSDMIDQDKRRVMGTMNIIMNTHTHTHNNERGIYGWKEGIEKI